MKPLFQKIIKHILTGLVVFAPAGITLFLLGWVFVKLDNILGVFFQLWIGVRIPGLGFLALVIILTFIGAITRSYVGRKLLGITDSIFTKLPVAKTIYITIKQLQSFLEIRKKIVFHSAVLLECPRKGIYVIGFLVSDEHIELAEKNFFPIFVPTTPNPTSGFLIFAERNQFARLDISIEDAMKLVISAGIITTNEKDFV
ncbi:DUF502 domain-containing protein [bacterium]|nr:DUF502 domain-containing protein [bacterium]